MNTHGKPKTSRLNDLLHEKELEWRRLQQEHTDTLVQELAEKDELIGLEKLRFHKLKEDFEYNLQLLAERDNDLQKYEQLFEQFKANDNLNNHQVSEMKIKVDEFQMKFNLLQKEKEEVQHHYQMRLKNYQEEMNQFYSKKEEEHQKEKSEYEELKRKLQRQIRDTEEEIGFEKQKLLNQLEETIKQKEKEFQVKLDQNDAEIHSYQLKVKMLSRELDIVQTSSSQVSENLENNKENTIHMEKLLKEKEWELQDTNNMKDLRIKELEVNVENCQKNMKWNKEAFERKYCELEKLSNERENSLSNLRIAADDNERKLCDDIKLLQQQNQELELNHKRLKWQMSDKQAEKERDMQKYIDQVVNLEGKLKEETDMMNKATVARDVEIETLRSSEGWLRQEANKLKGNIDRLKKDLSLALDRERILENAKAQLELDWRRRYENKESDLYEKHDDLIRNLMKEKDEAMCTMKQKENEITQRENLIKLLQEDKEIAINYLQKHGINTDSIFTDDIPERDSEIVVINNGTNDLQRQNNQLKEVIKEMRAEMEMLSQQITSTSTPIKATEEKSNYVKDLEDEIQNLKAANRLLLLKIEDLTKDDKPPLGPVGKFDVNLADPGIKSYVKELNQTIGVLRNDKALTTASLKSKEATINHLNETVSKLSNEKQQLLVLIDNLKYDMSSKTKVYEQNISSLKDRISEIELHLLQSRSEAETYYKAVMERNLDATQVSNKLSDLKLQQSAYVDVQPRPIPIDDSKSISVYKAKLKLAVERIKELTAERSQLINVGNKLRAELGRLKDSMQLSDATDKADQRTSSNMRQYGNQIRSKLDELEQLQYEATVNELKKGTKGKEVDVNVRLMSTDISDITESGDSNDIIPGKDTEKENLPPSPLMTTSSEHSSIKEIWKLLENAEEMSITDKEITIPTNADKKGVSRQTDDFALVGKQIKPDGKNIPTKSPISKPKNLRKAKNKPKIRNYNKKEDT